MSLKSTLSVLALLIPSAIFADHVDISTSSHTPDSTTQLCSGLFLGVTLEAEGTMPESYDSSGVGLLYCYIRIPPTSDGGWTFDIGSDLPATMDRYDEKDRSAEFWGYLTYTGYSKETPGIIYVSHYINECQAAGDTYYVFGDTLRVFSIRFIQ